MKIVHVCPFVGEQMGGSERYVYNLSKVQSKNHDVHIYTTTQHLDRVGTSFSDRITIHKFYSPKIIWNVNPITLMLGPLMKSNSDVYHIHSYLYTSSNQAVIAKLLKRKRSLLQLHGGVGIPPYDIGCVKLAAKHFYDRSLGKFTIKNNDLIASVSKSDLETISTRYNIGKERLRYVPNMVDTDLFKPHSKNSNMDNTLLYLGDLEPWKGIGSLMKWIYAMNQTHSQEVTIRFVGQGSYMKNLLQLREKLRKSDNGISLEILGSKNHNEIPNILQSSSALILPSYWEGMPTVVLEAMASGVPVISTRVGDVPYLITNKETGFLIDRSLNSFQEALNYVFCNPKLSKGVSRNARKLVESEFNFSNVSRVVSHVYAEVYS